MRDVLSRILKDDPNAAKQMWETALSYFDTPTAAIQVRRGKKDPLARTGGLLVGGVMAESGMSQRRHRQLDTAARR